MNSITHGTSWIPALIRRSGSTFGQSQRLEAPAPFGTPKEPLIIYGSRAFQALFRPQVEPERRLMRI